MQEEIKEGYSRFQTITVLDDETIKAARANFGRFRMKGVIFGGRYDDDAWHLSDDLCNSTLIFSVDETAYVEHAEKWTDCTFECYKDSIKAYIALNLGTYARATLMIITRLFRDVAEMDYEDGRLVYALLRFPADRNRNRYVGYQVKEASGNKYVTVVYLTGKATTKELKVIFKHR